MRVHIQHKTGVSHSLPEACTFDKQLWQLQTSLQKYDLQQHFYEIVAAQVLKKVGVLWFHSSCHSDEDY